MTLQTAVAAVGQEAGYTIDTSNTGANWFNTSDITTQQLIGIAQRVTNEMFQAYPWWQFNQFYNFGLVAGQATYPLPGDISSYHYDTFWNTSNRWRCFGPMSPQEYSDLNGYGLTALIANRFMLQGISNNQLTIFPTPDSTTTGQNIYFEYISDRPIRPWIWTASTNVSSSGYTFYNGNYYSLVSGVTTGTNPPVHTVGSVSDGSCVWAYYSGPYNAYRAPDDQSILKERILTQGMLERFGSLKGLNVDAKFDSQLEEEYSNQYVGKSLYTANLNVPYVWAEKGRVNFGGFSS